MAHAQAVCAGAREQVSRELDGELSQLERRMLDVHLERCPPCLEFAADARAVTGLIRSASLEVLGRPVVVRRRRRVTTVRLQAGVAAAFALAALGLGTQISPSTGPDTGSAARVDRVPALSPPRSVLDREQAILRVVKPGRPLPPSGSLL